MGFRKKVGFTLVELLVVMSIIGVLAAALVTQVSKMQETARAMKCKANLKNLATAAINYGVDHTILPWAGSHEHVYVNRTSSGFVTKVGLRRGWVDWTTSGATVELWPKDYSSGASFSGKGTMKTAMDGEAGFLSVTNGALWSYMGKDLSAYGCEAHKSRVKSESRTRTQIHRSYFMNSYFGYNKDYSPLSRSYRDVSVNALASRGSAANLLLFAELPVKQSGVDDELATDGVIETKIVGYSDTKGVREVIGFNHTVGRRAVAHVAYADGHVDVHHLPSNESSLDLLRGLTYFLCNGYDLPKETGDWRIP